MMRVSDEHFRRRTVIATDGQAIVEVGALVIDTSAALRMKLHNAVAEQLGAVRRMLRCATLELPVRMVQSVGDAVLLSLPNARTAADSSRRR